MTFILVIAFVLPVKTEAAQVFSDVPPSHPNYYDITYLLSKNVIDKSC
ncbi:hypothetical protein ACMGD3_10875 [Lysinibacillus sphaericus]